MSESYLTTDRSAMLQAALDNLIAFAEDYLDHRPHDPSGLTLAILDAKGAIRRVNELAIPAPEEPEIQKHGSEERMEVDPRDIPLSRRDVLDLLRELSQPKGPADEPPSLTIYATALVQHFGSRWSKWGKR